MAGQNTMMAVECGRYGSPDVLHLVETARPTPSDDEILVRIHAATVTSADCRLRSMTVPAGFSTLSRIAFGVTRPRKTVLGSEFAGTVVATGQRVSAFKIGDRVFGLLDTKMGCHAEYCCVRENGLVARMPEQLSYREAAGLTFGGTTALDFLRRGKLQESEEILINGASGSVGCAAIQIARSMGGNVTAVCGASNAMLVKDLGASHVIDYTHQDFAASGKSYDVIMDTVGNCNYRRCKHSLNHSGRLILLAADLKEILHSLLVGASAPKRVLAGPASVRQSDIERVAALARSGSLKPVLDRVFPITQIREAHRYVDTGRKRGNVVIEVISDERDCL